MHFGGDKCVESYENQIIPNGFEDLRSYGRGSFFNVAGLDERATDSRPYGVCAGDMWK